MRRSHPWAGVRSRPVSAQPFTHLDESGRARMVDVSAKAATHRRALAEAFVRLTPSTVATVRAGDLAKGDVLAVARLAGIQAAKRTSDLVPLCHPVRLDAVHVTVEPVETPEGRTGIHILAEAVAFDRTGVEMEALTAALGAALAVYDMVKGIERRASIEGVRLLEKDGGRSGTWRLDAPEGEA